MSGSEGQPAGAAAMQALVPDAIELYQLRAMLLAMPSLHGGRDRTLHDDFDAAILDAGGADVLAWHYQPMVRRTARYLARAADALGVTSGGMDAIFIGAASIQA